jgi:hypothetical protein
MNPTNKFKMRAAKVLAAISLLTLSLVSHAGTIQISQEPSTNTANGHDDFIINSWNGGSSYTTMRINLSNLIASVNWSNVLSGSNLLGASSSGLLKNLNDKGTNILFFTSNQAPSLSVAWTNDYTTDYFGSNTPMAVLNFRTGTNPLSVNYGPGYGQFFLNTGHGGSSSSPNNTEHQWTSPGNFAFGPGFGYSGNGHFQWGIGVGRYWHYMQTGRNDLSVPGAIGVGVPFVWATGWNSNGVAYAKYPGIISMATSTNGDTELDIMSDLGNQSTGDNWNTNGIVRQVTLFNGPKGTGMNMRGVTILQRTTGNIGSSSFALDFRQSDCVDLSVTTTNAITFYTTNATGSGADFESRFFIIRSGFFSPSFTWPSWSVVGNALPASMSSGQILRLRIQSVGPGETNRIADAFTGADATFSWDTDASNYVAAAGITTAAAKQAINTFVLALKADGTWNQFTNGAIYPFAAATANGNAINLINTNNYKITWSGSLTHSSTGVKGDGASGYGDTHWTNANLNSASLFTFFKTNYPVTFIYPIGAYDGTHFLTFRHGGLTDRYEGSVDGNTVTANNAIPANINLATGVLFTRTNSSTSQAICDYNNFATVSDTSTVPPSQSVYVMALNNQGSPANYWGDYIQVAAVGAGLQTAQYQTLYAACTNLNATLGR